MTHSVSWPHLKVEVLSINYPVLTVLVLLFCPIIQIQDKVKEVEQSKAMSQEFSRQIQKIAKDLTTILTKLRAKTDDLVQAKTDQKVRKDKGNYEG